MFQAERLLSSTKLQILVSSMKRNKSFIKILKSNGPNIQQFPNNEKHTLRGRTYGRSFCLSALPGR